MTNWRGRVGADALANLVQESLRVAHDTGACRATI